MSMEKRFVEAKEGTSTERFLELIANFDIVKVFDDKRSAIVEGWSSLLEMWKDEIRLGCPQK